MGEDGTWREVSVTVTIFEHFMFHRTLCQIFSIQSLFFKSFIITQTGKITFWRDECKWLAKLVRERCPEHPNSCQILWAGCILKMIFWRAKITHPDLSKVHRDFVWAGTSSGHVLQFTDVRRSSVKLLPGCMMFPQTRKYQRLWSE